MSLRRPFSLIFASLLTSCGENGGMSTRGCFSLLLLLMAGCGDGGDKVDAGSLWSLDGSVDEQGDGDGGERGPDEPVRCLKGFYRGGLSGTWFPTSPAGVGAMVRGEATAEEGIWLLLVDARSEFGPYLKVERACVLGTLQGDQTTWSPVVSALAGEIYCSTSESDGVLRGFYGFSNQTFEGIFTAKFARGPVAQLQGEWTTREKRDGPEGHGTWYAVWQEGSTPEFPKRCTEISDAGL